MATGPRGGPAEVPGLLRCRTETFAGYNVAWSPFFPARLAVASSQNFGLVGNGRLHLLSVAPPASINVDKFFDTQDGLYDLAWSEIHENQIATGSGDGSVKLWDVTLADYPIRKWQEHQREVYSVDWSNVRKDLFSTSSWDHTVKIWTPERPTSITTVPAHTACVYSAKWSPHHGDTVASCAADGVLKLWDMRASSTVPALELLAHPTEALALDWNKYAGHLIATSSVDRSIRIHDLRLAGSSPAAPSPASHPAVSQTRSSTVATLLGHEYAVRNVAFSPHSATEIASCGYDMTQRTWDLDPSVITAAEQGPPPTLKWGSAGIGGSRLRRVHDRHTEFVVGCAWSYFEPGVIATTSWDCETHIFAA